jgi:hypothetical protein
LTNKEKQVTIILLVWWSLAAGKPVVPSRWQATASEITATPAAPRPPGPRAQPPARARPAGQTSASFEPLEAWHPAQGRATVIFCRLHDRPQLGLYIKVVRISENRYVQSEQRS